MNPVSRRKQRHQSANDDGPGKRVVSLPRASTAEQRLSLGAQRDSIRRYTEFKQWELVREFECAALCGKAVFLDRPQVREMLRFMEQERIDTIICTRMDRLFRSQSDSITTLDILTKAGIFLHFCEQNMDPSSPTGRALYQMLGTFAELETNLRQQRQLEAFDEQRRLNQKSGNHEPYGWQCVAAAGGRQTKERRAASDLLPVVEQQIVLGWIVRLARENLAHSAIAAALNAKGIPTSRAGRKMMRHGAEITCSGQWAAATVHSVSSFARLTDERFASDNPDDVEDAADALRASLADGTWQRINHGGGGVLAPA